jgi:hypothetical protein
MKKIISLSDLESFIDKLDIYQDVNGKAEEVNIIDLLQLPFIDVISLIKKGKLFYAY